MSYKHLAGRLVEVQRSIIGQSAITIAQSIDGLTVTDGGTVKAVDGDPQDVLEELSNRYTDMLGEVAQSRLRTAATEFQSELQLPPSLAPDDAADPDHGETEDQPTDSETGSQPTTERRESTATDIEITSPREGASAAAVVEQPVEETADPIDQTVFAEYSLQGDTSTDVDADLHSVYLLTEDEHDWQVPVTVADAIRMAIGRTDGVDAGEIDELESYVNTDRILSTLYGSDGSPVSFEIEDAHVTLYASGTVRVRHQ